jgi:hypothetical protein
VLIAPELAPITFSVGFLERPLGDVAAALRTWYREVTLARSLRERRATLTDALHLLEPLRAPFFSRVWIATTSTRWRTAYFDGFINGSDPFPPVSYLAQRLGCHGLVLGAQPDGRDRYGATSIALHGPAATEWLNVEWSVSALNDGGRWTFQRMGPTQPFEEPENYERRHVRDRFTPDMLRRYAAALGVPLDATSFGPECVLDTPAWWTRFRSQRRETLAVARARFGLVDGETDDRVRGGLAARAVSRTPEPRYGAISA